MTDGLDVDGGLTADDFWRQGCQLVRMYRLDRSCLERCGWPDVIVGKALSSPFIWASDCCGVIMGSC